MTNFSKLVQTDPSNMLLGLGLTAGLGNLAGNTIFGGQAVQTTVTTTSAMPQAFNTSQPTTLPPGYSIESASSMITPMSLPMSTPMGAMPTMGASTMPPAGYPSATGPSYPPSLPPVSDPYASCILNMGGGGGEF